MNSEQSSIEEILRPFQEKIKKLEEEISQKDLEIAKLKFQSNQNKEISEKDSEISKLIIELKQKEEEINKKDVEISELKRIKELYNQMNTYNIYNQMNMMNNMNPNNMNYNFNQMNMNMNSNNLYYNLFLKVRTENGEQILLPYKMDDNMEIITNKLCLKMALEKQDYDFYIIKEGEENIVNINSKIEEYGIFGENDYILAKKRNDDKKDTSLKNGPPITILFTTTQGLKAAIIIDRNSTFREATISLCRKLGVSTSVIEKLIFLHNASRVKLEDKISQLVLGFQLSINITILDQDNILGA